MTRKFFIRSCMTLGLIVHARNIQMAQGMLRGTIVRHESTRAAELGLLIAVLTAPSLARGRPTSNLPLSCLHNRYPDISLSPENEWLASRSNSEINIMATIGSTLASARSGYVSKVNP